MSVSSSSVPSGPYDPLNFEHLENSDERLSEARAECPVSRPRPHLTVVATDKAIRQAINDPARYSNFGNFSLGEEPIGPIPVVHMMDPPEHTVLRNRLRKWLAPAQLRAQEPRIREVVTQVADSLPDEGVIDLYDRYFRQIPPRIVFSFLGMPEEDWQRCEEWADEIAAEVVESIEKVPGFHSLLACVGGEIERRFAAEPTRDSVIDGLVHPEEGEQQFSPIEATAHAVQLVFAGTDTTRSLTANLAYELLRNPGLWERLNADRSLIPMAIEESLRHDPPAPFVCRTATEDTELEGCPVPSGQRLMLSLQSAGADEEAWGKRAKDFHLDHEELPAHLSFGYGIHTCIGAPLARLEARIMFETLLDRYPNMRLADGFVWERFPGIAAHRPKRLDVSLA